MDLSLTELRRQCGDGDAPLYCYVVASVGLDGQRFRQPGSGPNFEGGRITLCTCKHWMRTYRTPEEWRGVWVAGVTGANGGGRGNLFYLMRVSETYGSPLDMFRALDASVRRAKLATWNPQGDIYEPKAGISEADAHDARSYKPPVNTHSHYEGDDWKTRDIEYRGADGRHPALLLGDKRLSFLWSRPMLRLPCAFRQKTFTLGEFVNRQLETVR